MICQGVENQRKERYHTHKGKKFHLNGGYMFSTYHSSSYRIESGTTCNTKKIPRTQTSCERVLRKLMWL